MAIFVLPAILMFFYATAAMHFRYTPDSTYVYLQFARNFASGDGISFTPGVSTYGITSPLWMGLISVGGLMKIDLLLTAKLIDLFMASMALLVFFFLAYELIRDIFTAIAATLTFGMNVWFLRWAGTGMESSFAVLLLLGTMWFAIRNDYFTAIVLAALLGFVRPEGWLIVVPIGIDIWFNSFNKRRASKMIAALGLIFIAFITPWLIYAWITFGSIIPNGAIAKSLAFLHPGEIAVNLSRMTRAMVLSDGISGTTLILGLLLLWFRARGGEGKPAAEPTADDPVDTSGFYLFRSSIIPIGFAGLVCVLYVLHGFEVVSRDILLVSPIIVLFGFLLFHRVVYGLGNPKRLMIGVAVLAMAIMLQNQITYFTLVRPDMDDSQRGMETCFIPIGKWFNANTPAGTIVFGEDIGALGYFGQRPIVDAAGMVSPEVHPLLRAGKTTEEMYQEKRYRQFGAQYIVHESNVAVALAADKGLEPILTDSIRYSDPVSRMPAYYTVYRVLPDTAISR